LIELMQRLESEMKMLGLWSAESPPTKALESLEPFCVDTLSFSEWVQWVMIPRMHHLILTGQPLPTHSSITPMAEEDLKGLEHKTSQLRKLLHAFDQRLTLPH
jgi:uncharacterized protein YqcC (DUF446 family)